MDLHSKIISQFCESPLMLWMNPGSKAAAEKKKIPIFVYELNKTTKQFVALDYNLAASDSEQIAVDGIAKAVDPDSKTSGLHQGMQSSFNAIGLLRQKLNFLIEVVSSAPEVRANHDFMRRLNQIVNQVPIAN